MFLSGLERDHVRRLIIDQLILDGELESKTSNHTTGERENGRFITPEGEDLSEHYPKDNDDSIPF
jgi:hypothetical protein